MLQKLSPAFTVHVVGAAGAVGDSGGTAAGGWAGGTVVVVVGAVVVVVGAVVVVVVGAAVVVVGPVVVVVGSVVVVVLSAAAGATVDGLEVTLTPATVAVAGSDAVDDPPATGS